ncbi:MAG: GatB/YqeY domain-containing protein [Porphyromonas sp.]|nr:GatB/YqeY domain-containing protein [Porphyromonas sp.]
MKNLRTEEETQHPIPGFIHRHIGSALKRMPSEQKFYHVGVFAPRRRKFHSLPNHFSQGLKDPYKPTYTKPGFETSVYTRHRQVLPVGEMREDTPIQSGKLITGNFVTLKPDKYSKTNSMSLFEDINQEIKKAMLAREKVRLEALRGIKKEFLEAITAKGSDGTLHDEQALKILRKLHKQRLESAEIYKKNGRQELAEIELAESEVIGSFLPAMMSQEQIEPIIRQLKAELGIGDIKMMGKLIGAAQKKLEGQADGATIASVVKRLLSE